MLTGGTGSFGRAFIAHVLKHDLVERIYSFSRNAHMRYRLRHEIPDPRLTVLAGDVADQNDVAGVPEVDVVIHAAAEKHIDTGEANRWWVQKNNVDGTDHVARFAESEGAMLVALSTDKACNPVNEYGRSKADAERLVRRHGGTCVRYGNVVGSSGSVIPLFIEQRKQGRLTITDRRMTRYFMPLSPDAAFGVEWDRGPVMSAVELVLYALKHGQGGEIFVPQIPSGSIQQLAEQMAPDCVIEEVGIRPGEKLHEELIASHEHGYITDDGVYVLTDEIRNLTPLAAGYTYTSADSPRPVELREGQPCVSRS